MDWEWLQAHNLSDADIEYAYLYNVAVDNANYAAELEKRLANADAHIDNAEMAYRDERRKVSRLEDIIVEGYRANESQIDRIQELRNELRTRDKSITELVKNRDVARVLAEHHHHVWCTNKHDIDWEKSVTVEETWYTDSNNWNNNNHGSDVPNEFPMV